MSEIVDYIWITGRESIGIVLIKDEYDGYKSYIGVCKPGNTSAQDVKYISEYGSKFPMDATKVLFKHINFEEK